MKLLKEAAICGNIDAIDFILHNGLHLVDIAPEEHTYYTKKCVETIIQNAIKYEHINVLNWCMKNGYFLWLKIDNDYHRYQITDPLDDIYFHSNEIIQFHENGYFTILNTLIQNEIRSIKIFEWIHRNIPGFFDIYKHYEAVHLAYTNKFTSQMIRKMNNALFYWIKHIGILESYAPYLETKQISSLDDFSDFFFNNED